MGPERVITAGEMDAMSPDERATAVRAGEISSLEGLPDTLRQRALARAAELEERLSPSS